MGDVADGAHLLSDWVQEQAGCFWHWAYTYLTFFRDGARLITGSQELPGWEAHAGAEEPVSVAAPKG